MNEIKLKQIKRMWTDFGRHLFNDEIDFLFDEIERLQKKVDRCIDIVEEKTKYLSCTKDGHGIADAIRKEFGEVERNDQLCDAWIDVAVERTATDCADIAKDTPSSDGQNIAEAIRKKFNL